VIWFAFQTCIGGGHVAGATDPTASQRTKSPPTVLFQWQGITNMESLSKDKKVQELFQSVVDATNAGLARFERVKRFRILPMMLSIDGGHLTPTMKVKRRAVAEEFALMIDAMYAKARGE